MGNSMSNQQMLENVKEKTMLDFILYVYNVFVPNN